MTKLHFHRLTDVLCGTGTRLFTKSQIIAAFIGAVVGAFLGVQAYYHGWLG